ncbi:hypothetical protein O181_094167 [Austropuccinia psidii MF-1]|uniref:Integrase catalytic domain-containing protein n=1 Tax=Austropuccinia psidii MF-1 TaxID=1389203 RepID=A0A9Q3PB82_9BASI|nr:hypothetical protein [Austropuccinia psidii MF-1]
MNQILNVFNGSSNFSKIYLHGAYNLLRIKEGDEHLTAFRTEYGSFDYLVMLFGLTNAPASSQNLVNDTFQDLLHVYVVVCLDEIIVFSKSKEEHVAHVSTVLSRLRANNLFAKVSKCLFQVSSVEYLGYVVSSEGLNMDQAKLSILRKRHDSPLASQSGQEKTLKLVKRDFHWSSMTKVIKDHVTSCQLCSRNKNIHHKKFGLLKPLPIPNDSQKWPFLFQQCLQSLHYIWPSYSSRIVFQSIVIDRGPLFVSFFWTNLCQQLKISRDLSTAYNPETDGQTERVNQILEQYLCMYVSYHQDDWNTWFPLAEFSYNNSDHSSTKQLPFFLFMEEIHNSIEFTSLKTILLEIYQQKSNQYSKMSRENLKLP